MLDLPPPPPAYECVEAIAGAASVVVLSGRNEDVNDFLAALAGPGPGWALEARASAPNGYAFLRYRIPHEIPVHDYVRFRGLAADHRLAVSNPIPDPPLGPLPGEAADDALAPPAPVGWSVDAGHPSEPEPEARLILHGSAADMENALDAAQRLGWRVVSQATGANGDRFAIVASRGNAFDLEERMLRSLSRLRIGVGLVFPVATDAPAR